MRFHGKQFFEMPTTAQILARYRLNSEAEFTLWVRLCEQAKQRSKDFGWSDLRLFQEIIAVGVSKVFAHDWFRYFLGRVAPRVCIGCGRQFRNPKLKVLGCGKCGMALTGLTPKPISSRAKENARSTANVAVKRGKLIAQPCRDCGSTDVVKHHEDYSKPLDVVWLCRQHHKAEHSRKRCISGEIRHA